METHLTCICISEPIPKTITPEWEQANREYSKKNHANYEAISAYVLAYYIRSRFCASNRISLLQPQDWIY